MAVVDSSFLVALFLPYDINHEKAVDEFSKAESLVIPYEILMETLTVLLYKEGIEFVREVYDLIESADIFIVFKSRKYAESALDMFLNQTDRLSIFDCMAISLAKVLKQELLSFDRNQLREFSKHK